MKEEETTTIMAITKKMMTKKIPHSQKGFLLCGSSHFLQRERQLSTHGRPEHLSCMDSVPPDLVKYINLTCHRLELTLLGYRRHLHGIRDRMCWKIRHSSQLP